MADTESTSASPNNSLAVLNALDNSTATNDSTDYFYNYEYDYDDSVNSLPVLEIGAVSIIYGLTLLLGVTGNLLVILAIVRIQRMRNVTNTFLMSLATSDLMILLFCLPIKYAKFFSFTWDFGVFLCKGVHYLQNVSIISSVLTLTSMSLERHYAILHPLRSKYVCTKRHARVVLAVVWVLAFILAAPILHGQALIQVGMIRKANWCVKKWPNPQVEKAYELGMLCLVFVVPIAVMTFAYAGICKELWLVDSRRQSMMAARNHMSSKSMGAGGDKDESNRKQVIKMLVAVIVLYALCHGPSLIDKVLVAFGHVDRYNYGSLKHIRQAFAVMSYFNSCVNPIVYAFMSKNFREGFKIALCMCLYREDNNGGHNRAYSSPPVNYENVTMMTNVSPRPTPHPSPYSNHRSAGSGSGHCGENQQAKALNSNCLLIADTRPAAAAYR